MLAVYIATKNDRNGNPRRGWIVMDQSGEAVRFVEEGYRGNGALADAGLPDIPATSRLDVTPGEFAGWRKWSK